MMFPTDELRVKDSRLVVATVGPLRSTRRATRSVFAPAGISTKIAYNETPFPYSVFVQPLAITNTAFGPQQEIVAGMNALRLPVVPYGGVPGFSFVLQPYVELWVISTGAANTYRVTESRV